MDDMDDVDALLAEQVRYYRERAREYDDWWVRRGRYDGGPDENRRWFAEVAEVEAALERFDPRGDVLELACGTGLWTRRLAPHASSLTALDSSPEVLAINRDRVGDPRVEYVQADLFRWQPPRRYDVCFMGFWLSHVPETRLAGFWRIVDEAVGAAGRVFLVDSASRLTRTTVAWEGERARRRLVDGREFDVVKRIYEPEELERILAGLGWKADLSRTASFFLYGSVARSWTGGSRPACQAVRFGPVHDHSLPLQLLPGSLAIARLPANAELPGWLPDRGSFVSLTRTSDELSVVCEQEAVPANVPAERGWRALAVAGTLDFALTGVLSSLAAPLAAADVPIFVVSTHDTDYVLVRDDDLPRATGALRAAGHSLA